MAPLAIPSGIEASEGVWYQRNCGYQDQQLACEDVEVDYTLKADGKELSLVVQRDVTAGNDPEYNRYKETEEYRIFMINNVPHYIHHYDNSFRTSKGEFGKLTEEVIYNVNWELCMMERSGESEKTTNPLNAFLDSCWIALGYDPMLFSGSCYENWN